MATSGALSCNKRLSTVLQALYTNETVLNSRATLISTMAWQALLPGVACHGKEHVNHAGTLFPEMVRIQYTQGRVQRRVGV